MSVVDNGGSSSYQRSSMYDAMKKNIPPPKRDFQESNPPRNLQELYDRYDPSIGAGIAIALGSLLIYLMAQVAIKFIFKNIKRGLQRTKKFGKYFPEENFPPLHVVQKLAAEQGIEIPESLLSKLIASDNAKVQSAGERRSSTTATPSAKKSSSTITASTMATNLTTTPKSPEDIFFNKACQSIHSMKETEFLTNKSTAANDASQRIITVNIIGATPAITPNPNHKPYYPPCPTYTQIVPAFKNTTIATVQQHKQRGVDGVLVVEDDECDVNYDNVVVTRATIENFPLLLKNDADFNNDSNYKVPSSCAKCGGNNSSASDENSYNRSCYYHSNLLIKNETVL